MTINDCGLIALKEDSVTGRSKNADGPSSNGPAGGTFTRSLKAIRKERAEQQEIEDLAALVQAKHSVLLPELAVERRRLTEIGYVAPDIIRHPAFRKVIGKPGLRQPEPHITLVDRKIARYELLKLHLVAEGTAMITMTFVQIEKVIGYKLPKSARQQVGWWSNEDLDVAMHVQCKAWREAGFDAYAQVGMRRVIFRARCQPPKSRHQ